MMSSQASGDHVPETGPEVVSAGDVADSLDDGGEPGQDVAGKMPPGVELSCGVNQEYQVGRDVADQIASQADCKEYPNHSSCSPYEN